MRCASSGGARAAAPAGSCWSPARTGSARRGWRPSWPARCTATAARCSTRPGRARPETALAALARARVARRPTLLVLDDADRAGEDVRAALGELVDALAALPVLVRGHGRGRRRAAGLRADATLVLGAARRRRRARGRRLYAGEREDAEVPVERLARRAAASRGACTAPRASGRAREAAPPRRRRRRPHRRRARRCCARPRTSWPAASSSCRRRASAPSWRRSRPRASSSARSRASPRSTSTTPASSSGASGSSPSWSRGCRRAAAGRRRAVGQRQVVGAARRAARRARRRRAAGQRALGARAAAPGRASAARARAGDGRGGAARPAGARGRPVRGAVHRLPRRAERAAFVDALVARARDPRRRALVLVAVRADFYGRCAAYPELSRLLGANHVLVGPMRRDELRRAIELPGAARRPARRARARPTRCSPTSRASRARCRCCRPRCSSCGSGATAAPAPAPPTSRPAACAARSRGWPSAPTSGSTPSSRADRAARSCCGSPARARATPSCAAASRSPSSSERRRRASRSPCSPTAGCSRSARARSRSRTRRCCASGRACAAGSRRTPRAAACTATSATPRATGTPAAATPASSTAARGWPPRSTGPAGHERRAQRDRARVPRREPRRASARRAPAPRNRACARCWPASPRCSSLAVIAGVVALDQRGERARRGARAADAQRLGAQALLDDDLDRSLLLAAPGRRARRLGRDARQPARRAAAQPGGDRRDARATAPRMLERRPQPRRAHARRRRQRGPGPLLRHADPAARRHTRAGAEPPGHLRAGLQPGRQPSGCGLHERSGRDRRVSARVARSGRAGRRAHAPSRRAARDAARARRSPECSSRPTAARSG